MSLKDFINADLVNEIATKIQHKDFNRALFEQAALLDLETKEYKDRILHLAQALHRALPQNYPQALDILVSSLGPVIEGSYGTMINGKYVEPMVRFVEEFGLDYPQESLQALEEMTQRNTAEFAVRPFIDQHYKQTMQVIEQWTQHHNEHVRRAASESVRPKLPWAMTLKRFVADPVPVLQVLDQLVDDSSKYVQKSVANNINDISKTHPDLVLETAARWLQNPTESRVWIVNHGLRTLIKSGDQKALELVGATGADKIEIKKFSLSNQKILVGDTLEFSAELFNSDTQEHTVVVDYIVHFKGAKTTSAKVFKAGKFKIVAGETKAVTKKHSFKVISTRKYYPGLHTLELQVNGMLRGQEEFILQ